MTDTRAVWAAPARNGGGQPPGRVPVRTILATIGLVVAAALTLLIVYQTARVLIWVVIAGLFAVAICPAVDRLDRRFPRCPRSLATLVVFLLVVAVLVALIAAIVVPLVREGRALAENLPRLIEDARAGKGPVGDLLVRVDADEWLARNQDRLKENAAGFGAPAVAFLRTTATGLVALVTIITLAFLMVLQGPRIIAQGLAQLETRRAERIRAVCHDCARTITGYVTGNLLISAICGTLTYVLLTICGVPFPALIALFVALADLVPLVGAAIGASVAVLAGLTRSATVALVVLVFFVVYQQVENHLLQPLIYSRTVSLNPLAILVAVLVFGQLAGILGTLLAVPAAGIIQVLVRDAWHHRRGAPPPGPPPRPPADGAAPRVPVSLARP